MFGGYLSITSGYKYASISISNFVTILQAVTLFVNRHPYEFLIIISLKTADNTHQVWNYNVNTSDNPERSLQNTHKF